jgi:hypothetical protein
MDIIIGFLTYNWIFKYYLMMLLIFNIMMFYNFAFLIHETKRSNPQTVFENESKTIFEYNVMFKKLVKISKNPIIFEYQLEQINKFFPDTNKYIKHKKYIQNINNYNNSNNSNNSVYKYYNKIKQTLIKNKLSNVDEIIIKLLCVNFS